MLKKMLREHPTEYLAVAFDRTERTVRHDEYDGYKANRPAMEQDLERPDPRDPPRLRGLPDPDPRDGRVRSRRRHRDARRRGEEAGFDVVIVTADKDMLQLVSGSRVRVFHTGREKFLDEKGVAEFFGVVAGQVVDVLALMGDTLRQHPGRAARGGGHGEEMDLGVRQPRSAPREVDEIKGKVGESLREHREDAILSRRLAAIRDGPADPLRCPTP